MRKNKEINKGEAYLGKGDVSLTTKAFDLLQRLLASP